MPRLTRVEPYTSPGWTRVRRGGGFSYVGPHGERASARDRARFAELAVPPAWKDVWIADAANAHLLAVGVDAAGRRQYLYNPIWRERQDIEKFDRMVLLARVLPEARLTAERELSVGLAEHGLEEHRVLAAAFRTLDLGALRVGSEESLAAARHRGLTTLLVRNATVETRGAASADATAHPPVVRFRFRAKDGIAQDLSVGDAALAGFVTLARERAASARLYAWRAEHTRRHRALTAAEVNDDIRRRTGGDFTAKDFRTLRGTIVAAERLAEIGVESSARARAAAMRDAVVATSVALGNTPAIAKASYVDPRVFTAYDRGVVLSRRGAAERALIALVAADAESAPGVEAGSAA
ncbi:DNA topoisomerase IB [Agromyces protaetiae]|uniref:DNA topoisomerase n=1 Tax=Agromyces protaetiae TaxID=2509455 RepID=A0A4P6F9U2_9MICO|nr:DNA topoisomerase IB [Agromyces protaetiae]QAY72336.1 DNA topoisomerase IB [Agromyces protaetiae]